ncbi:MAG: Type I restriction modification DNA specificity domain-containing protein [uncultured Clostridium sp.]
MNSNTWVKCKINDICRIRRGASPRPIQDYISEQGIPWVKISDATSSSSRFIDATNEYIKEDGKEKSRFIEKGTLILSNSATPGIHKIMGIDACVHDGWLIIDEFKNVTQEFLYYSFIYERDRLLNLSNGSVFRNLKTDIVKNYEINLPGVNEQKAIVKVLSNLDEKIETNNKINKKLEEIAQAIFKQWFVDFEFPNEEGKPYKSSGGEMIESELGMIPKGWGVDSLSNLVKEVITGKTPSTKKSENYGDKYPFVTIPDMHNKVFVTKTERYLSEDGHKLQEKKLIPKNSIMVSCIATVGLVSISSEAVHTNQQINSIIPNSIEEVFYFYEYLKLMEDRLKGIGSAGSATLNVNKGEFEKIKYIYPDSRIINKYNNTVKNIYEKIKLNEIENNRLVQLRDILLPKLMSGEIRVPLV